MARTEPTHLDTRLDIVEGEISRLRAENADFRRRLASAEQAADRALAEADSARREVERLRAGTSGTERSGSWAERSQLPPFWSLSTADDQPAQAATTRRPEQTGAPVGPEALDAQARSFAERTAEVARDATGAVERAGAMTDPASREHGTADNGPETPSQVVE